MAMFSTDWSGRLLRAAVLVAGAGLFGCTEPAGESALVPLHGESLQANLAVQADRAGTGARLERDFRASAEPAVTFAFDDAALDTRARAVLDSQALWLQAHPGVRMTITGHTDLVGAERYNFGLGLRRAQSARDYLVARGVSPDMLEAVTSQGESQPVVPTAERERRNRRAVTEVAGAATAGAGTGTGIDGNYAARLYDAYQTGRIGATEVESITVN